VVVLMIIAVVITHVTLAPLGVLAKQIDQMADLGTLEADQKTSSFTELSGVQEALTNLVMHMQHLKSFIPQNVFDYDPEYLAAAEETRFEEDRPFSTEIHAAPPPASAEPNPTGSARSSSESQPLLGARANENQTIPNGSARSSSDSQPLVGAVVTRLNAKRLAEQLNIFTPKRCSILVAELALHHCSTKAGVERRVKFFMETVMGAAQQWGGIIELQRPEVLIVTFNAILHETKALNTAIRIAEVCGVHPNLVTVAVDSGDYLVGNCGVTGRAAHCVFGPMIDTMRRLPDLSGMFKGSMLLVTEATALKADPTGFTTFPVDVVHPRYGNTAIRIYDIAPTDSFHIEGCRIGFSQLMQEDFAGAIETLSECLDNPHCLRLLHRAKHISAQLARNPNLVPKMLRHAVFPWEDLDGDLRFTEVPGDILKKYSARFRGEDLATLDEGLRANQSGQVRSLILSAQDTLRAEDASPSCAMPRVPVWDVFGGSPPDIGASMFASFAPAFDASNTVGEGALSLPKAFQDIQNRTWYRSEVLLGKGSFGSVYQGMNDQGSLAALKFLHLKAEMATDDLMVETEALCRLEHENIAQFISACVTRRHLIFVLELVPGGSLSTTMATYKGRLPSSLMRKFALDILRGLEYLHRKNVVHCDIKPDNVLVASDGTCKISDFGSAIIGHRTAFVGLRSPRPDTDEDMRLLRGTIKYMAPEVAAYEMPTSASDMWSFGITIAELAIGTLPWAHLPGISPMAFLARLGSREITPQVPDALPSSLAEVIKKCWEPSPAKRATATELLAMKYFQQK
jgi:hypothetical protein